VVGAQRHLEIAGDVQVKTTKRAPQAILRLVGGVCLLFAVASGWAQNFVVGISGSTQGDIETVRIEFAQPLAALPTAFVTQNPARIALDFVGVSGRSKRSTVDINQTNVQSADLVQTDERSRVVLSLKRLASYALQMNGGALLVTLESTASTPQTEPPQNRLTVPRRMDEPLGAIEFRRGEEGAGRVRLALPSSKVSADIRQVGSSLVVDLSNVSLPERLRRRHVLRRAADHHAHRAAAFHRVHLHHRGRLDQPTAGGPVRRLARRARRARLLRRGFRRDAVSHRRPA
jgi:type IV pilus assembly protein PilQ